jgi:hypothetical protein
MCLNIFSLLSPDQDYKLIQPWQVVKLLLVLIHDWLNWIWFDYFPSKNNLFLGNLTSKLSHPEKDDQTFPFLNDYVIISHWEVIALGVTLMFKIISTLTSCKTVLPNYTVGGTVIIISLIGETNAPTIWATDHSLIWVWLGPYE